MSKRVKLTVKEKLNSLTPIIEMNKKEINNLERAERLFYELLSDNIKKD